MSILRFLLKSILLLFPIIGKTQSVYMHEAQEDGGDGISGILSLVLFFGLVYIIIEIKDFFKSIREENETYKKQMGIVSQRTKEFLQKHTNISIYQNRETWIRGFKKATYDISYGTPKELREGTIQNLQKQYEALYKEKNYAKAESIMEEIGYFQKIEFNAYQLEEEIKRKKAKSSTLYTGNYTPKAEKPNEEYVVCDNYTLSTDRTVFIKSKDVEEVIVPDGVKVIKEDAFKNKTLLRRVKLPRTLIEIESWAFSYSSLESIEIPHTVKKFGHSIFANCEKLQSVKIEDGITILGESMFYGCISLEHVSLPSTLKSLPNSLFQDCTFYLNTILIPEDVTSIGDYAFCGCHYLDKIVLPENLKEIGRGAFRECFELKQITIPQNIIGISEYTFYDDFQLEQIELPQNLTCIMSMAFANCENLKIKLPPTITYIDSDAFEQCSNINIEVVKGKKEWLEEICADSIDHICEYDAIPISPLPIELANRTSVFLHNHKENE